MPRSVARLVDRSAAIVATPSVTKRPCRDIERSLRGECRLGDSSGGGPRLDPRHPGQADWAVWRGALSHWPCSEWHRPDATWRTHLCAARNHPAAGGTCMERAQRRLRTAINRQRRARRRRRQQRVAQQVANRPRATGGCLIPPRMAPSSTASLLERAAASRFGAATRSILGARAPTRLSSSTCTARMATNRPRGAARRGRRRRRRTRCRREEPRPCREVRRGPFSCWTRWRRRRGRFRKRSSGVLSCDVEFVKVPTKLAI